MYLFAPVAFAMKVAALHLWSIFTPKSGANAKEREKRMHFGAAQRFAASIAGVRQMSLKLSAKAPAGLPRSVRGYAALWRGMVAERGAVSCYVPRATRSFAFGELAHIEVLVFCVRAYGRVKEIRFRGAGAHQGACVLRPSSARVEHPGSATGLPRSVRGYAGL